jgi:uncharacterized membrane-anchored protein YjiN (DUF445 family)
VRRLTNDEHLSSEFATTWPTYDLDAKTRALLAYAKKLTQEPSMVEDSDIEELRSAGWAEQAIYEATALVWKRRRDCRWIGYQKERSFPKRRRVSLRCRSGTERSRRG